MSERRDVVEEFIDYIRDGEAKDSSGNRITFATVYPATERESEVIIPGISDGSVTLIMGAFLGIDPKRLDLEKQAMLDAIRTAFEVPIGDAT